MVTITDVAREADVSIATVSRVLNNNLQVMPETRRRVLAAVEKLGYEASPKKKAAASASPRLILVITNTTIVSINNHVAKAAAACGYQVIFNIYQPDDEQHILQLLDQTDICGIIFCCAWAPGPELVQALAQYPVVELSSGVLERKEQYRVLADEQAMAGDAVRYLIHSRCKHIGMLSTATTLPVIITRQREAGYIQALSEAASARCGDLTAVHSEKDTICSDVAPAFSETAAQHHETVPPHIVYGDYTCDGGYHATKELLHHFPQCDGIFCICDMMAIGCLNYLHEANIRVPGQVSVISLDNMEACEYTIPPLSTVDAGNYESALEAVRMLHGIIEKDYRRGRTVYIEHQLVVRQSTRSE